MRLEQLFDFEWLNEPEDVDFRDAGMAVTAKAGTDFWQNKNRNVHKDDGHFFFTRKCGNFVLTVHWAFSQMTEMNQCGIMIRSDEQNWIKASIMTDSLKNSKLGSCVSDSGYTDWALQAVLPGLTEIWFRIKRLNGDYLLFYSSDGENFQQIRLFNLPSEDVEVKVGAYICAPKNNKFQALLKSVEIEGL